jgi:hypothetical protein
MERTAHARRVQGAFAQWQPRYAAVGIPTFPLTASGERKRPLVRGYSHIGLPASGQLALKFLDADGLACMAGARNKLTVVDIDAHGAEGERLLADAQRDYGASRFIVRTGGGGFHAHYRHNGEGRRIRPDPRKPVDLLGGGVVVLPPSRGASRCYEIIQGTIDDLAALTPIRRVVEPEPEHRTGADVGRRNNALFHVCMKNAHHCDNLESLLDVARTENAEMLPPMDDAEVVKVAASAWSYEEAGQNFVNRRVVVVSHDEVDNLMSASPDAFMLLYVLRRHHWDRPFVIANAMADTMPGGGWRRHRFAARSWNGKARSCRSGRPHGAGQLCTAGRDPRPRIKGVRICTPIRNIHLPPLSWSHRGHEIGSVREADDAHDELERRRSPGGAAEGQRDVSVRQDELGRIARAAA